MTVKTLVRAGLLGLAFASAAYVPPAMAETLRVSGGTVQRALKVPMNRAVVVESDIAFAELSIANPGIADISTLSEQSIYVLGKAPGRTTLTLLAPDGSLITNVEVQVTADVGELKERLREVLPGEAIEVRPANDGIVLSGTVTSAQAIDRAIDLANRYAPDRVSNLMMVGGTQQVMMKVRFAEMSRSVRKSLGFSTSLKGTADNGSIGYQGGTGAYLGDTSDGVILDADTSGALQVGFGYGDVEFAVLIEALESKGFVRTLAEPNLTALSGQAASFLAGGEYPVPSRDDDGNVTVFYKPFGIVLNMTPRVIGENINLNLKAEVSQIDTSIGITDAGFSISGFSTRNAQSTVELRDGESFAIAGLLQDDFADLSTQVPWLGDVPVLGALFRSADYQREQSELVIIVTAHLVTPTRGDALALPTDRVRPPSENQLFMRGITAVTSRPITGGAGEVARQDFTGSYGYVME
ncbi:type II and III secretion system protein family protein [Tropicimonas isoalkanivorans]|uniref:Pilus assembly protein CpaC n=1 Tax=Tropicimonas isoalkanivorans TaxID=441112 RepID=A0A1I1IQ67_9RHOB|nr:type II and III secretion system protein family protein [Tropicimonas isoalkanivorans]SFC38374.1 pilus assembly protein CpaC [Tropicimonas isoalkanivorans]